MLKTTQMLIASLIIISILFGIFGYVLYMMSNISVPTSLPEVHASLRVACTTDTFNSGGFYQSYITSIDTSLLFGVKNHYGEEVTIDKIYPLGLNISSYGAIVSLNVPPYKYVERDIPVNWLNMSGLSMRVFPGDVVGLEYGMLKRKDSGKIVEYINRVPTTPVPSSYHSPFVGNVKYDLDITGTKISAEIQDPGYAANVLLNDIDYSNLLVLTEFKPVDYYYEDYDIPYYLDIYTGSSHTGFYLYANGIMGIIGGGTTTVPIDQNIYAGLWVSGSTSELYINDQTSPSITASSPNIVNGMIAFGVAREREAESSLKLLLVFWNHGGSNFYFDGQWKHKETDYLYFVADPNTGNSYLKMWGPGRKTGSFNDPESWKAPPVDSHTCRSVPPYFWIMQVNPSGPDPCDPNGVCHGNELLDLIIGWDDTQGTCIEEKFRVTIFEDGYARVEHISTAGSPYDEVFIAPIGDYAPGSDNDGDGYPDNWYHIWSLTNQRGGVIWKDVSEYIHWEKHPVSSNVYYEGVFKGRTVTITGLYPGDKVILATPNRVETISADTTSLTVDLIQLFGVKELIEALKNGGVLLIIQPSSEHIISLLPSRALVHVKGKTIDTWLEVPLLIKPECVLTAGFTSSGILSVSRAGEVYKAYVKIPGFSNPLYLGTYPKIYVYNLRNYEISISYEDGTSVTIKPGTPVNFAGQTRAFYDNIAVLLIDDKVVILDGLRTIKDTKAFRAITIKGVMDIEMHLAK